MILLTQALTFVVIVPLVARGQASLQSHCELHVSVQDSVGQPLRARLLLLGSDLLLRSGQADGSGEMAFVHLPEDDYTLIVRAAGGQEIQENISTRNGNCLQSETVRFSGIGGTSHDAEIYVGNLKAPESARRLYRKGVVQLQRQHWPEAQELFTKAVAEYPEFSAAYNGLGVAASECRDFDRADTAFREAIRLRKNYSEAYLNHAKSLIRQQRFSDAELLMNNLLAYDHGNRNATTLLVESLFGQRKFDAVIELVQELHARGYVHDAFVHEYAAEIYRRRGMTQEFERENAIVAAESRVSR